MDLIRIIVRNMRRHLLRSVLSIIGVTIALFSFCMIRTMIDAWYAGVRTSAKDRMVVRNKVSLVFYLPIAYKNQIMQTSGVSKVGYANWFGGVYKDEKYRFAQFAIDENYLDVYPEYLLSPEERAAFASDRKGAIIGEELSEKYGLKVGEVIQLQGTIFPGLWEFTIHGIFRGRDPNTRSQVLYFHWDYLNERNRAEIQKQVDNVGFFVVQLSPGIDPASVTKSIDERFANSFAETLTETETAFQQSFVSMSSTIIIALNIVSLVVLLIMVLVLGNTIFMSVRERFREYAILKAIGFDRKRIYSLIIGESLAISIVGFILLCVILAPIFSLDPRLLLGDLVDFFPVFELNFLTVIAALFISTLLGVVAAIIPARQISLIKVSDGLRKIA